MGRHMEKGFVGTGLPDSPLYEGLYYRTVEDAGPYIGIFYKKQRYLHNDSCFFDNRVV